MKKYGKFAVLIAIVIGTLVWLAGAGMKESQTYYKTVAELSQMGVKRISVGSALTRVAYGAVLEAAREMREKGTFGFAKTALPTPRLNEIFTDD